MTHNAFKNCDLTTPLAIHKQQGGGSSVLYSNIEIEAKYQAFFYLNSTVF